MQTSYQSKYGTYTGRWAFKRLGVSEVPYASARVWGTGYNPVHEIHGEGDPLRTTGREGAIGSQPGAEQSVQNAAESVPEMLIPNQFWGYGAQDNETYTVDPYYMDDYADGSRMRIGEGEGFSDEVHIDTNQHPPWQTGTDLQFQGLATVAGDNRSFRETHQGTHRIRQKLGNVLPLETVTEGWRNKPKGAEVRGNTQYESTIADPISSAPAQYERQTSYQQRYVERHNLAAQMRATDDPRHTIMSRVVPQKLKVYSEGERHYDMDPYQQDEMLRPFYYRQFGSADPELMAQNAMYVSEPYQRIPPADPSLGQDETAGNYGYTAEDMSYG